MLMLPIVVPRYCLRVLGGNVFLFNSRLVPHEHVSCPDKGKKYILQCKHIRTINYFELFSALRL